MATVERVDQINQDSLIISMEAFAARLDPTDAVLDVLIRQIGGGIESVGRMETKWRERRLGIMSDTVGAAGAAQAATSIPVANPSAYHLDQIITCVETGDMFFVDETVGGTAVAGAVKVRGKAGNGGITTALTEGMVLLIGPEAHAEGEDIPPAFANTEATLTTYVMQMDETVKVTDILNAEEGYGQAEIDAIRADKMKEQLKRMSIAYYTSQGGREIVSAAGARRHTMTGLNEYLESQITDASAIAGGLTLQTLGAIIRPTTIYGDAADKKIAICGQNAWVAISAMPLNALREASGESKAWGVEVNKLITPFGTLPLVYDPMLSQENGMAGEMYVLDKRKIKQIQLRGLPLVHKTNVQNKDQVHQIRDLYTGTRGLKMHNVELSRRITGI